LKKDIKWWFFIPGLLGLTLSRIINIRYGIGVRDKVGVVILAIIILYLIFTIIYFIAKKYYWLAIGILTILIPFIVYYLGLYSKNELFKTIGVVALLLIMVGWYIFLKLHLKNKNK